MFTDTQEREKKNIHTQTQKILRKREKTGRRQGKLNKTCRHNINKCKLRHTVSKKDTQPTISINTTNEKPKNNLNKQTLLKNN